MKSILLLLFAALTTIACTSSETKEKILKIYEEGTTQIRKADTQQDINDISYDVAKKIVDISKGPDGEEMLSASEQMELQKAQQEFYQAIEKRARQLTPTTPQQSGPILRP